METIYDACTKTTILINNYMNFEKIITIDDVDYTINIGDEKLSISDNSSVFSFYRDNQLISHPIQAVSYNNTRANDLYWIISGNTDIESVDFRVDEEIINYKTNISSEEKFQTLLIHNDPFIEHSFEFIKSNITHIEKISLEFGKNYTYCFSTKPNQDCIFLYNTILNELINELKQR